MGHFFYCFIVAIIGFIVLSNCPVSVKVDGNFCDALWANPSRPDAFGLSLLGWTRAWSFFFCSFLHLLIQVSVEIDVLPPDPPGVTGSPVFSLLTMRLFATKSTGRVPVRRHLRVFSWCCYWVGDWFSVGTVVLISCDVQSGGGVGRDEGLLMSERGSLNLLGLHVSCVSMLAVWGQICVQFTERILYKNIYWDYIL